MKEITNDDYKVLTLQNEKDALIQELVQTGIDDPKVAESIVDEHELCEIPTIIREHGEEIFPEGEVEPF